MGHRRRRLGERRGGTGGGEVAPDWLAEALGRVAGLTAGALPGPALERVGGREGRGVGRGRRWGREPSEGYC